MKSFSSQSDADRRLYAPGLTLPADAGPARPLAATPRASLGVSSRSPARPCRPRADLMWQTIMPPTEQSGRASHLEARPGPAAVPGLAVGPVWA